MNLEELQKEAEKLFNSPRGIGIITINAFLEQAHALGKEEQRKEYKDICTKCRGKGYSTNLDFYSGHGEADMGQGDVEVEGQMPYYLPCDCERGKQFTKAQEYAANKQRKRILESIPVRNASEYYAIKYQDEDTVTSEDISGIVEKEANELYDSILKAIEGGTE